MIGLLPVGGLLSVLEGATRSRQIVLDNGSVIDYGGAVGGGKTMTHFLYGDGQGGYLVPECYHKDILAMMKDRSLCLRAHHVMSLYQPSRRRRNK